MTPTQVTLMFELCTAPAIPSPPGSKSIQYGPLATNSRNLVSPPASVYHPHSRSQFWCERPVFPVLLGVVSQ